MASIGVGFSKDSTGVCRNECRRRVLGPPKVVPRGPESKSISHDYDAEGLVRYAAETTQGTIDLALLDPRLRGDDGPSEQG